MLRLNVASMKPMKQKGNDYENAVGYHDSERTI
jgi:hypothetical protein